MNFRSSIVKFTIICYSLLLFFTNLVFTLKISFSIIGMSSFHESGPKFSQLVTFIVCIYVKKIEKSRDTWPASVVKLIIAYRATILANSKRLVILFTIKTLAMWKFYWLWSKWLWSVIRQEVCFSVWMMWKQFKNQTHGSWISYAHKCSIFISL